MRILLINDTSVNPNFGCQATTASLYMSILKMCPTANIDAIFLTDLQSGSLSEVTAMFDYGERRPPEKRPMEIRRYDLAIINGEGSITNRPDGVLHSDCRSILQLIHRCYNAGVPAHLINFTHGVNSHSGLQQLKKAYAKCASVSVREPISYRKALQLHSRVRLYPDLVCTLAKPKKKRLAHIMIGGGTCLMTTTLREATKHYLAIIEVVSQAGCEVSLIGWPAMRLGDDVFFKKLISSYKPKAAYADLTNYTDYMEMCRTSTLCITGRHHGVVMAFATQCPFVGIDAFNWKVQGDVEFYGGSSKRLRSQKLLDHIATTIQHPNEFRLLSRWRALRSIFDAQIRHIWEPYSDLRPSFITLL
jgi:polysaccharide pyruvyl transferase WcaK-like protein